MRFDLLVALATGIAISASFKGFGSVWYSYAGFLESPYEYWAKGGLYEKRLTLKLVFSGNLVYDHKLGFETASICSVLKVFEQIAASKSQGVEMGGIEPPSKTSLGAGLHT